MAVLFISHSSKDDALAGALEAWLNANGFTDIFVDHHRIAGGDKWREALRAASGACRVVLCLITPNWLSSSECFGEFEAAWYMGKRIVPLFLLPPSAGLGSEARTRFERVCGEDQGIDLLPCVDTQGGLNIDAYPGVASPLKAGLRAAGANTRVGLDPEAFAIDAKLRPTPFPGLAAFGDEDADAAIFYGRSREIAHTLEELRKVRADRDRRPLVILGASGAGKSSLLKAGIIPRLRRETPAFLPLRAFRPGADPLLNFAEALSRTFADYGRREAHGQIRDRLLDTWSKAGRENGELTRVGFFALDDAIDAEGRLLRAAADRAGATILISVDQAWEMASAEGKSAEALADYLRVALATERSAWQLAFTIRTDSFPELQNHRRFQNLEARGYDLRAIPIFRFDSVVEEPAKRYGVIVDNLLVDALMEDAPKEDALPLLAFALQRLWRQYGTSGSLTNLHYHKVGGLRGLIEDAAERAMRGIEPEHDVPLLSAPPPKRQTDLAVSAFVPALVEINDQGAAIRHIAKWSSFNEEQQELLRRFDRWRLMVRKGEADGGTVEVAHEALFRTWKRLESWLEPERARLAALRALQFDAGNWHRSGKNQGYLNHRSNRLAEARRLCDDPHYAKRLIEQDFAYLAACQAAERIALARERRGKALVAVLLALLGLSGVGFVYRRDIEQYVIGRYLWHVAMDPSVLTAEEEKKEAATPGPDSAFAECKKGCPAMIVVPAGKFMMGSRENEVGRSDSEGPRHEVTIAKPFAVAKFQVTFEEWDACVAAAACGRAVDRFGRGRMPVINVGFDDAKDYVRWLAWLTGKEYRLLTEAEWEYAARAGTTTRYYWGDELGENNANCSVCGGKWGGEQTAPVGSFAPNAFGLYEMYGNTWEWVEDWWHGNYEGAPLDGSAWLQDSKPSIRVVRGGAWLSNAQGLRAAFRVGLTTGNQTDLLGFRVARTLNP